MRGDRKGPENQGPKTGRGLGYCSGSDAPGYMSSEAPMGMRRGGGRGMGRGTGRGMRSGRGMGYGRGYGWNSADNAVDERLDRIEKALEELKNK